MRRKILSLMLVLSLMMGMLPLTVAGEEKIGDMKAGGGEVMEVPVEGLVISGGTYYGISKAWFESVNPDKGTLYFSIRIPETVTTIANDGFRDSYSSDKKKYGAVTSNDEVGRYYVKNIDFSSATNLSMINNQAAMGTEISGVLDLSNTKVEIIGKSAFSGCGQLTGVILPETLKSIGSVESGSVFKGCTSLQYVRTAGGYPDAVFELPEGLETIGKQSFYGCSGLPENTTVSIPESVTYIGSEAFYYTPSITTIVIETEDASGYDGGAFKGNDYGLGERLTVFKNSEAKNSFSPSGSNAYSNSMTYEFTLHYGEDEMAQTELKLYGQALNVCKNTNGTWEVDEAYQIPETSVDDAPIGYDGGWSYDGKILTEKTVLKPDGDDLYLDIEYVLENPKVEFTVDGRVIKTENTYPKLNVPNDGAVIGVKVSHPLEETKDAAGGYVKFKYEWIDVWKGGSEGPRNSEPEFDVPFYSDGSPEIEINGAEHERTCTDHYSGEDFGDGYYEVIITGYYYLPNQPAVKFYQSARTNIGSDPDRTVDTAYMFDVITSEPAEIPQISIDNISVDYGYQQASFTANLTEEAGYHYEYQWYEADKEGQIQDGRKIDGAVDSVYSVQTGKNAGVYYYYLEVTAEKSENGDIKTAVVPVKLTVNPQKITIIPDKGQSKYWGQEDPSLTYTTSGGGNVEISGMLAREEGESIGTYNYRLGSLSVNNNNYKLELSEEENVFTIKQYQAEAIFSPDQPDGNDGWYLSEVTVTPPNGHSISMDGGKTWSNESITIDNYHGDFAYLLRSENEDGTKGAIAENTKHLRIDTVMPTLDGLEDGKTYCIEVKFQAADENLKEVLVDGQPISPENGFYVLTAGKHTIIVSDLAGNVTERMVKVNEGHTSSLEWKYNEDGHWQNCTICGITINEAEHTFQWRIDREATETESGLRHEECDVCGYERAAVDIPATGTPGEPSTPDDDGSIPGTGADSGLSLWLSLFLISGAGLVSVVIWRSCGRKKKYNQ